MSLIDLRSDTVTKPTEAMRLAMARAEVGDDMLGEDPTVNRLEEKAAELTGKEAALFVSSGMMGNQLAVLAQTNPGDEIISEQSAHIFVYELAALARIGMVQAAQVQGLRGVMPLEMIGRRIRPGDNHRPRTALICLENTHNLHGGAVLPMVYLENAADFAKEKGIPVHMDGARVFNAAAALGVSVREIARHAETVTFCLSKGLCAPVGSVLCGPTDVIGRARHFRHMLGGAMRQSGVIAAAGITALDTMAERLSEDHENAKAFAKGVADIPGIEVDSEGIETNIVYFDIPGDAAAFAAKLSQSGLLMFDTGPRTLRAVTHYGVDSEDIRTAIQIIRAALVN